MTPRPRLGLLALTLELYESLAPDLRASREAWVRRDLVPALAADADVLFTGAVFRREDLERTVRAYEADGAELVPMDEVIDAFPESDRRGFRLMKTDQVLRLRRAAPPASAGLPATA